MEVKAQKRPHSEIEVMCGPVKSLISPHKISSGVSSLLKTLRVPNSKVEIPSFDCEAETIYLQFATKNIDRCDAIGRVTLPNSLSYARSVCIIARCAITDETVPANLKESCRDLGITGEIAVFPVAEFNASLSDCDHDKLFKMAESYDSFIIQRGVLANMGIQRLHNKINQFGKYFNMIRHGADEKTRIKTALDISAIMPNDAKDAYVCKVGHTAMSVTEIEANVTAALNVLSTWTSSFPESLAHFSAVRLANGGGIAVELYANAGDVVTQNAFRRRTAKELLLKGDQQLYWLNRLQQEDGFAYWKLNDNKLKTFLKGESEVNELGNLQTKTSKTRRSKSSASGLTWIKKVKEQRKGQATGVKKTPKTTPGEATVDTASKSKTTRSGKKRRGSRKSGKSKPSTPGEPTENTSPKSQTPVKVLTPLKEKLTTPVSAKRAKLETPGEATVDTVSKSETPGSGKKRRRSRKSGTPKPSTPGEPTENTSLKSQTPVKVPTPLKEKSTTPVSAKRAKLETPGEATVDTASKSETPGSGKKRRRSRKSGTPKPSTPGQPTENTSLKSQTPVKVPTPLKEKSTTPGSAKVNVSANGVSPAVTPGSGKKRRRSRRSVMPGTPVVAKENTPLVAKATTPVATGNNVTPGSGGKRRKTRRSFMPGTPGVGTPGSEVKTRLRQRISMSIGKN